MKRPKDGQLLIDIFIGRKSFWALSGIWTHVPLEASVRQRCTSKYTSAIASEPRQLPYDRMLEYKIAIIWQFPVIVAQFGLQQQAALNIPAPRLEPSPFDNLIIRRIRSCCCACLRSTWSKRKVSVSRNKHCKLNFEQLHARDLNPWPLYCIPYNETYEFTINKATYRYLSLSRFSLNEFFSYFSATLSLSTYVRTYLGFPQQVQWCPG